VISAILDLFKHRHKWETTHVNRYQHATAQVCKCGAKRSLETRGFGNCVWVYEDGSESKVMNWGEQ
jgi:hypothetical protein